MIGKVGVVVGTLVGCVTLYRAFSPEAARVVARCEFKEIDSVVFSDIRDKVEKVRDATKRTALAVSPVVSALPTKEVVTGAASKMDDAVAYMELNALITALDERRTVAVCEIENSGSKDAKSVMLAFPFKIGGAKIGDDLAAQDAIDGKAMRLGDIRPGETRHLAVWTTDFFLILNNQELAATFADGRGEVQIAKVLYGPVGSIARAIQFAIHSPVVLFLLLLQVAVITMVIILVRRNVRHHKPRKRNTNRLPRLETMSLRLRRPNGHSTQLRGQGPRAEVRAARRCHVRAAARRERMSTGVTPATLGS
jgi:hypothetical protein